MSNVVFGQTKLLKWQNGAAVARYPPAPQPKSRSGSRANTPGSARMTVSDSEIQGLLAESMSFAQIEDTSKYAENNDIKRKQKWKELTHFYAVTQQPSYRFHSLEKALWFNNDKKIDLYRFISAMSAEYQFDCKTHFDDRLRMLYLTFDGGITNEVLFSSFTNHFDIKTLFP